MTGGRLTDDGDLTIDALGNDIYLGDSNDAVNVHVDDGYLAAMNGGGTPEITDDGDIYAEDDIMTNDRLYFATTDTELYRTATNKLRTPDTFIVDGSVGIGTTSPSKRLHVVYDAGASSGTYKASYTTALFDGSEGRVQIMASYLGNWGATLHLTTADKTWSIFQPADASKLYKLYFGYDTQIADNENIPADSSKLLTIQSDGNVGINDTTPTYKLDVNGTGRFTGAVDFDGDIELNSTLTDINGSVGSNGQLLSSTGSGVDWIDASGLGTDDQTLAEVLGEGNTTSAHNIVMSTTDELRFYDDDNDARIYGPSDGQIQINSNTWDITGAGAISGLTGVTSSGTITFSGLTANRLVTTTTGGQLTTSITSANVDASVTDDTGSGALVFATSPTFTTQITVPQIISSADLTINPSGGDVNLGSGDNLNLTDSTNLFFGSTSLGEHSAANDSGAYKVGVFDEFDNSAETNVQGVLDDLDSHIENLETGGAGVWTDAAGYIYPTTAGNYGSTGMKNPGAPLHIKGTGDTHQFIIQANSTQTEPLIQVFDSWGPDSGTELFRLHTNHYTSIFLGSEAGTSQTGNYGYNTFLGSEAGYSSTSSQFNTLVGYGTGYNNNADYNTFLGTYSGYNNTSGSFNTFLGVYSGYSNTTGAENVFIGYDAGDSNESGSGNVFIGYEAGYNETGSNKLYIDNSNTSSPLIWGDFSTNILSFNSC